MQAPYSDDDSASLDAIFGAQAADLYRYIYRQVHQAAVAEDLTSAVFLKALRWLQQDRSQESVKGWLYATARTLIADYWREHAQLPLMPLEAATEVPLPAPLGETPGLVLQARIQRLLEGLSERERDVLTLRYLQGYSAAEIGEALGLSANYVRVLQFRALRRAAILDAQERSVPMMTEPRLPYSEQAQRVLALSQEEAFALHHTYVGTEHVLLGILREGSAPGAVLLAQHGITLENMRSGISFILGRFAAQQPGSTPPATTAATAEELGFTARTAQVLAMAGEEAEGLQKPEISPQHLLVAILREGQGVAAMLLQVSGVRWRQDGQTVEISVPDPAGGSPPPVPADLQAALAQHPDAQNMYTLLASFKQKQLIDQIEHVDGEAARGKAVERVIGILHQAYVNHQQAQGGNS